MACLYTFPWQAASPWLTHYFFVSIRAVSCIICPSPRAKLIFTYFSHDSKRDLVIKCFHFSNKKSQHPNLRFLPVTCSPACAPRLENPASVNGGSLRIFLPSCLWFVVRSMLLYSGCPLESPGELNKLRYQPHPDQLNHILRRLDAQFYRLIISITFAMCQFDLAPKFKPSSPLSLPIKQGIIVLSLSLFSFLAMLKHAEVPGSGIEPVP